MKIKNILAAVLFSIPFIVNAQWTQGSDKITTVNNIGIGIANPLYNLDVKGTVHSNHLYIQNSNPSLRFGDLVGSMFLQMNNSGSLQITNGSKVPLHQFSNNGNVGIGMTDPSYNLDVKGTVHSNHLYIQNSNASLRLGDIAGSMFLQMNNSGSLQIINGNKVPLHQFSYNGNVGIGTTNPTSKLEVAGTIRAREVKIEVTAGADHVFESDYNLKPLSEVETFVRENKHLPEIPSEKQMQQDGLSVNEFQIKLLQKIEELTLYLIEQKTEVDILKQKNLQMEYEINKLKSNK